MQPSTHDFQHRKAYRRVLLLVALTCILLALALVVASTFTPAAGAAQPSDTATAAAASFTADTAAKPFCWCTGNGQKLCYKQRLNGRWYTAYSGICKH